MTQVDALATALAATSVHTASGASEASTSNVSNLKTSKPSFASVFRSGQTAHSSILTKDTAASSAASSSTTIPPASVDTSPHAVPAAAEPSSSSLLCEPAPVGDTILQAIRKRDDRIFFSQYENQMAALVRDPTRTSIELGAMNAYQRLLVYRCADQFQLEHRLDRATNCITLSKTASTSHPSALLSIRAREFLVQRDGIDPVSVHPAIANLAASSTPETTNTSSPSSSASTSSPASPAPAPAAILSSSSNAPKPGFQIMRRDPSKNRQSPLCSADNDSNDPDKAAAKARKDMTLEERLASYRAARARIFGGAATNTSSGSASPTSSTPPPESSEVNDQAGDAASISRDHKASPSSSAASSLVASPVAARPVSRSKKPSSSATQDGPAQKGRGKTKGKGAAAQSTSDSTHDDPEFSRALPMSSHPASPPAFGALQQSSPLSLPGHVAHGYFPPMQHPALLQQSQSNPNLRSRAPAFHPQGSSTPAYSTGGGLRHPADVAAQTQRLWSQPGEAIQADAFPALGSSGANSTQRHPHPQNNGLNAQAPGGGAWNRSQVNAPMAGSAVGQEHHMNGVGVWAQQVPNNAALRHPQQSQQQHNPAHLPYPHQQQQHPHQHQQQHFQPAFQSPFPMQYTPKGQHQAHVYAPSNYTAPRSAASSRASSQRGGGGHNARDDAASVSSLTASSRSASFSGPSGASNTNATQQANGGSGNSSSNGGNSKPTAALAHPSLPARPAWLPSSSNSAPAWSGAEGSVER